MSGKRIDPDDGMAYTYDEMAAYYKGKYKKKVIEAYWNECTPAKGKKGKAKAKLAPKQKAKAKSKEKVRKPRAKSEQKKKIVIFGGTGAYLGQHVTRAALEQGHEVTVISRGRSQKNAALYDEFESKGAKFAGVSNSDIEKMVELFKGKDIVFSFPGIDSHRSIQIRILLAAKMARIKRFVPDEYGCDTTAIDYGLVDMFDQKKDMTLACRASGVPYTCIMTHAIATDWMMPTHFNQNAFKIVGTGDVKQRLTHKKDVATLAVKAACDPRCAKKCISLNGGGEITVNEMVAKVRANFPEHTFNYPKVSAEEVVKTIAEADDHAPPGEQSMKERAQLNKIVYIDGGASTIAPATLKATELWPDYEWVSIEGLLKDPTFVFKDGDLAAAK